MAIRRVRGITMCLSEKRQMNKNRLLELEKSLFKVKFMQDKTYLDKVLSDDYLECGKSGRLFGKQEVINELTTLTEDRPIKIYNFSAEQKGGLWVVHYVTLSGEDKIFRTSLWSNNGVMFFHQASKLTIDLDLEEF